MKSEFKVNGQVPGVRKIYIAPRLFKYGSVKDLTKSGATTGTEPTTGSHCKYNDPRKPCSERHVKENIVRVGDHPLGFGLYLFDYRAEYRGMFGCGRQFGVVIDEVETIVPEAVSVHPDGFKRVDYAMLGIERLAH